MQIKNINQKGFTLVELVISIGIFALMTTLLLAKFGTFNQGILLSNLAYDIALTLRNAQSYGLNVKSADRNLDVFNHAYGVHFDSTNLNNTSFKFFADLNDNNTYDSADDTGSFTATTNIKRGSKISALCLTSAVPCATPLSTLDITFKRPDPNAIINGNSNNSYAKITLTATDGSVKNIEVRSTGQIQVTN